LIAGKEQGQIIARKLAIHAAGEYNQSSGANDYIGTEDLQGLHEIGDRLND
jgi:hypothetical protein